MQQLRTLLFIGGMLTCLLGLGMLMAPAQPAIAQSLPDRPTLTPTRAPDTSKSKDPVATSRITGTVIDSRTGAPTAGVMVQVGDVVVVSDANGNYDRNGLVAGEYVVALAVSAERGVADQGTIIVSVAEDQTIVQHLAFHSPAAAPPAPAPAALPVTGGSVEPGGLLLALGMGMLLAAGLVRRRA